MYQKQTFCYRATNSGYFNVCCEECVSFCCSILPETVPAQICWKVFFPREVRVIFILGKIRSV